MRYILIVTALALTACAHKQISSVPSVSTARVIDSLTDAKKELAAAGDSNTKVAANIDKALTLAQKLDALLDQIEKEQQVADAKKVKEPIK